ncbi:MAG: hypothetical protein BGO78_08735 [Chloroflexi bacterium 44-23]|nr:MAG: hypothetical protein BGO78_08735 [Chloroflexi bacterium 44-23]
MSRKTKKETPKADTQEQMFARLKSLLSEDQLILLHEELEQPNYPALRINPLKIARDGVIDEWSQRYNWEYKKVPYCPTGYWITQSPLPISKTIEHSLGHYYIQDAASMLPAELFHFENFPNPIILDMAASPGGKTTHIVSRTLDRGLVIANDSSRERLTALRIVLQNWGNTHSAISNYPGEYFGSWFPQMFDAILLDAPCSMQGLRESDAHSLKPITQKEINTLARRQIRLLESAIHALKPNGEVVYSTCTLTFEENEAVLDAVLQRFGTIISIEPLTDILTIPAPALIGTESNQFNSQIANAARLWPHIYGTAGFFAARIHKTGSTLIANTAAPSRPLSQAGWFPLEQNLIDCINASIAAIYGIEFKQILDENDLVVWRFKNACHLFPKLFLDKLPDFPVQALGLPFGQFNGDSFELSHEFASRFGERAIGQVYVVNEEQLSLWMYGHDLNLGHLPQTNSPIWIIRDQLNRTLGVGKYTSGRLRNMLPRRAMISGQIAQRF